MCTPRPLAALLIASCATFALAGSTPAVSPVSPGPSDVTFPTIDSRPLEPLDMPPPGGPRACGLACDAGAVPEAEPLCGPNYVDHFNGGCNSVPEVFQPLPLGQTVCGQSGTFLNGTTPTRDTDWFAVQLTQTSNLTASVAADFAASLFIVAPGAPLPCNGPSVLVNASGGACETLTATAQCLAPGTYWVVVTPLTFSGTPCGSSYLVQATATPCAPPLGVGLFTGGLDNANILTPGDLNTGWSGPPHGGPWLQYPGGWWNEWWPNIQSAASMLIEIHVDIFTWSGGSVEVAANWSAPSWVNPLRPPLAFEDSQVVRHSFGTFAGCGSHVLAVTVPYCPLWVSVDVRGSNANVQGWIEYGCTLPPPIGACCLPGGFCQPQTAFDCGVLGGTWQGPGTGCAPNPCGGGGGGPGCVYADPRIRTIHDPTGAGSGLSRSPEVDHLGRVTETPGVGAGVDPADTSPDTGTDGLAEPTGPRSPITGTGTRSGSGVSTTEGGSRRGPGQTVAGGPETRNPPTNPPAKKKDCDPPIGGGSAQTSVSPSYNSPTRTGGGLVRDGAVCNALDVGLGVGWNYVTSVVYWDAGGSQFVMLGRDSAITTFRSNPRGGWTPSSGAHFDLTTAIGALTVRHKHGTRFHYTLMEPAIPLPGPAYLLTAIEDRNGLLTTYAYEAGRPPPERDHARNRAVPDDHVHVRQPRQPALADRRQRADDRVLLRRRRPAGPGDAPRRRAADLHLRWHEPSRLARRPERRHDAVHLRQSRAAGAALVCAGSQLAGRTHPDGHVRVGSRCPAAERIQ